MAQNDTRGGASALKVEPVRKVTKRPLWRRLIGWLAAALVALVAFLVLLPTIASATFLTPLVRSRLAARFGEPVVLQSVRFGWTRGLEIQGLSLPAGPNAIDRRSPIQLDGVRVRLSVPQVVASLLKKQTARVDVEVGRTSIYIEKNTDGTTNVRAGPEGKPEAKTPETKTQAPEQGATPKPPCPIEATVRSETIDLELVDRVSGRRTSLKGLRLGLRARAGSDGSLELAEAKGAQPVAFERLAIQEEPAGANPAPLLEVVEARVEPVTAQVAGTPLIPAAVPPGLDPVRRVGAANAMFVARIRGRDFEIANAKAVSTVEAPQRQLAFTFEGDLLPGPGVPPRPEGKNGHLRVDVKGRLESASTLPCTVSVHVDEADLSGAIAKAAPRALPLFDGVEGGEGQPPRLTLSVDGDVAPTWNEEQQVDPKATIRTLDVPAGELVVAGTLRGSKVLSAYTDTLEKLGLGAKERGGGGAPVEGGELRMKFSIQKGVLNFSDTKVGAQDLQLHASGRVDLATTEYSIKLLLDEGAYAKLPENTAKLFRALDKAGGVTVEGAAGQKMRVKAPSARDLLKSQGEEEKKKGEEELKKSLRDKIRGR
jgi:hypothetical protein